MTISRRITNLNCGYTLNFSWPEGLFTEVTGDDFLDYVYNKNSNSEPTALNNLEVTCDESSGNVIELSASESYWPNSAEFMFVRSSAPNGLIAGSSKLTYNSVKDAFITDSAYSKYYNANSPIGTAGSFHIVAFNEAHLLASHQRECAGPRHYTLVRTSAQIIMRMNCPIFILCPDQRYQCV